MEILKSIKSVFKKEDKEAEEQKATPAPKSEEPPVQPEVEIDTKIKRKELRIGDMLEGRYEIRDIKKGGMGSVYIAYDNEWHRMFAIKSFQEKFLWNKNIMNGFIKEAETWVNLGMHSNIVQAERVEKIHGKPYIFLEYIDGGDLTSWIGKLDIPQSLDFAIQVCTGMEYAYKEMGIVHRDIKPSNVMITKNRVAKVTDFGLVKVFEDSYSSETKDESFQEFSLVKTGSAIGTPPYMSPEQFRDTKNVGTESDIYSFGVMLYEMLTGRLPFYANSMETYMQKHLTGIPRNPRGMNSKITVELDVIVMQCLQKNPRDRYHNFTEIKKELMEIYEDITGQSYQLSEIIGGESSAEAWNNKGLSLANLGRFEEAITCYSKALEINPEDTAAWNNKGLSLANLYRIEEAVTCYSKALEINPKFTEAWNGKGFSLTKLHMYEEAIICFDKVLEINHDDDYAWNNKGASSTKLGRFEDAITCFGNALEINPEDELAWNNKGNSLGSLGRFEEAITCYSKALELNPEDNRVWCNKGNSLGSLGRFEEAVICYSKALELNPKDNRAWNNKGASSTKLGRFEDAITCYSKALELNPDDELAWTNKGVSLAVLGRIEEAITCFDKALEINPEDANARKVKEIVLHEMKSR
jgi:tetratricopeptide (TPR) repeat protein